MGHSWGNCVCSLVVCLFVCFCLLHILCKYGARGAASAASAHWPALTRHKNLGSDDAANHFQVKPSSMLIESWADEETLNHGLRNLKDIFLECLTFGVFD